MMSAVSAMQAAGMTNPSYRQHRTRPCQERKDGAPTVPERDKKKAPERLGHPPARYSPKQFGFDLAESLERNAGKIAEEVAANRLSDVSKFLTTKAPIAVFLPTPFALPSVTLEMPFTLVGRPVETVFGGGGGGRLLGFGTDFSGDLNMFFRIDLTFDLKQLFERHPPIGSGSDLTPGRDDYAAWNDNGYFHYHVPKH